MTLNGDPCADKDEIIGAAILLARAAARVGREKTLKGVYSALCEIGQDIPGLVMGWVGLIDPETRRVVPTVSWGDRRGYLSRIQVTWDDAPTGRGPVGTALRTGRIAVAQDLDDPSMAPWREAAQGMGFESVAALPLRMPDGQILGAMVAYSDRKGFFTPVRQSLLMVFAEVASMAVEHASMAEELAVRSREREERFQQRLEEETRQREVLTRSCERLVEASRYKTEFLSHLSHELRTPLTAILGFTEVLSDELPGPLNAKQKEMLGHCLAAGHQLMDLIDTVVDLSRVESGRAELQFEDCFPSQILEAAALQLGTQSGSEKVAVARSLGSGAEGSIRADARKLRQALIHLASHGLRSAGRNGQVALTADGDGNEVWFLVRWKRGATPEMTAVKASTWKSSSFGVILAQRLAEVSGGRLERLDAADGGAFRLVVPRRGPAPSPATPE